MVGIKKLMVKYRDFLNAHAHDSHTKDVYDADTSFAENILFMCWNAAYTDKISWNAKEMIRFFDGNL